ncbi:hypothetical protein QC761_606285 [Podospora bellae-mahoneyi]|uniref:Uncharacterized protein n=1 Tax=Podospora bellae-mahoneyi TaxID=2093777 RepID=A0ABR0FCJ8_9PEZI|nr:hypothetical protein QC761_606285 [Podospora bellae-mahoneyi]
MTFSRVPPQKPQRSRFLKREHKSNYLMESPISKPAPPCFPPACHPLISDQSHLNLPSQTLGSLNSTRKALPTSRTCFQQGGLPGSPHIGSGSRFSFQQGGPPGLVQRVSSSTTGAEAGVGFGTGLRFFQQGAPLHGWHRGSTSGTTGSRFQQGGPPGLVHLAARSVDGAGRARVEVVRVRRVRRGVVRCIFVCEVGWRLEGGYVGDGWS